MLESGSSWWGEYLTQNLSSGGRWFAAGGVFVAMMHPEKGVGKGGAILKTNRAGRGLPGEVQKPLAA
jgi:hypothetical protein